MVMTTEPPIKQLLESQEPIIRWKLVNSVSGKYLLHLVYIKMREKKLASSPIIQRLLSDQK